MEEAIYSLLSGDAGLTAEVSDRIFWNLRPQDDGAFPAIVLRLISSNDKYHMGGADGLTESRIQVDAMGETYAAAKTAARAVTAVLGGYRGTVGSTIFQSIEKDNERDTIEGETDDQVRIHQVSIDFLIWHRS